MKNIKSIFLPLWTCLLLISCGEEKLKPIADDDRVPGVVSNVEVENLAGKVKLSYSVPKGTALLYVESEVDMGGGRIVNTKASYYNNFLEIEGFGAAKEYEVKLYSVGRSLKRSEPIVVKVNPLEPPVRTVFGSLEIESDFGGLSVSFDNETKADLSITVDVRNDNNEWETAETFYTNQDQGKFSARGLEAKLQTFRIYVNDRWGNQSDILETELIPLYEEELDYAKFAEKHLLNDPPAFGANKVSFLWNDNLTDSRSGYGGWYRTENGSGVPNQITVDMGVTAKLSRFKFWQRGTISEKNLLYTAGSPLTFELWGSNNPSPDGDYATWIKLGEYEVKKPSGQSINTPEDEEVAAAGHEYMIPLDAPPVRYLRMRVTKTFGVTDYFWLSEIGVFGQPQ